MDFDNITLVPLKVSKFTISSHPIKTCMVSIKTCCVKLANSSHYHIMFMYNCGHPA